jgi:hypothetical protein
MNAWWPVLDAIEDAIDDVDGLHPNDRSALCLMHDLACTYAGEPVSPEIETPPVPLSVPDPEGDVRDRLTEAAARLGGIDELNLSPRTRGALLRQHPMFARDDAVTIAGLAAMTDAEILSITRIGPKALREIREALGEDDGERY